MLSKYKNALGEPGKGIHKYRAGGVAIMDYVGSIGIAFIISYIIDMPVTISTILVLLISIILHALFGVNTATLKYIKSYY